MFMNWVHGQCLENLTRENTESKRIENGPSAQPAASLRAQAARPATPRPRARACCRTPRACLPRTPCAPAARPPACSAPTHACLRAPSAPCVCLLRPAPQPSACPVHCHNTTCVLRYTYPPCSLSHYCIAIQLPSNPAYCNSILLAKPTATHYTMLQHNFQPCNTKKISHNIVWQ